MSHVSLEIGLPSTCTKVFFFFCTAKDINREPGLNSVAGCQEWLGIKLQSGQNTLNCGCHCHCSIAALCNLTTLVPRLSPSFLSLAVHLTVLQAMGSWVRPWERGYNLTWSTSWFGSQTLLVQGRNEGRTGLVNNSVLIQSSCLPVCYFNASLFCTDFFSSKLYFRYFVLNSQFPLYIIDKPITIKVVTSWQ